MDILWEYAIMCTFITAPGDIEDDICFPVAIEYLRFLLLPSPRILVFEAMAGPYRITLY